MRGRTLRTNSRTGSDNSFLKIVLPSNLKMWSGESGLKHSQSLFGPANFGGDKKIVGELIYVTPDHLSGCDEYSEHVPATTADNNNNKKIFIVDRGSCDFVVKAKVAQKMGASAVIIADNVCQCSSQNALVAGKDKILIDNCKELAMKAKIEMRLPIFANCEPLLPYMSDDGQGFDVSIPVFLVDYLTAIPLKDCFFSSRGDLTRVMGSSDESKCATGTKIIASLEWNLPRVDDMVEFQLWSSSDSEGTFKKAFVETAAKLAPHVLFSPRYFIWAGEAWGCTALNSCASQCTDGGQYCAPDPDKSLFRGVSGRDVVEENLREMCIWQISQEDKDQSIWWKYVSMFATDCHPGAVAQPESFNAKCSERVQVKIGVDPKRPQACVDKSWTDSTFKGRNVRLDAEIKARDNKLLLQLPTAIVNGVVLRGGVTPMSILTSICAGFKPGNEPGLCACTNRASSSNLFDCINSACQEDERFCGKTRACYKNTEWSRKCSDVCQDTEMFCPSLSTCMREGSTCPVCPADKPAFCVFLKQCVDNPLDCMPSVSQTMCVHDTDVYCPSLDRCLSSSRVPCPICDHPLFPTYCTHDGTCVDSPVSCKSSSGTSMFAVVAVTAIIVSGFGLMAFAYWKRQKAKINEDVRAILGQYMPLEEMGEVDSTRRPGGGGRVGGAARVAVDSDDVEASELRTAEKRPIAPAIGGNDAATYI